MPGYRLVEPLAFVGQATRATDDIYLEGRLTGVVESECSRCLKSFSMPVDLVLEGVYVLQKERQGKESDVLELDSNLSYYDGESLDLLQETKDLLLVNLPIKPVCRPDCRGLCPQCGTDLNEDPCTCEQSKGPSPFDKLKDLKAKLEGK